MYEKNLVVFVYIMNFKMNIRLLTIPNGLHVYRNCNVHSRLTPKESKLNRYINVL
jgi:hypothetical protein